MVALVVCICAILKVNMLYFMCNVQNAIFNVQYLIQSVNKTKVNMQYLMYNVQNAIFNAYMQYLIGSVKNTKVNIKYFMYSVQNAICNIQCAIYYVQCSKRSVQNAIFKRQCAKCNEVQGGTSERERCVRSSRGRQASRQSFCAATSS